MFKTLKFLRNKCLIFSSFLFLILVIYSCNPNDPDKDNDKDNAKSLKWGVLGKEGFSSRISPNSDIANLAFDNKGTPYVAYMDYDNENKATVMKYNGSSWGVVGKAGFSTKAAVDMSLAIDKNSGIPYIAYRGSEWGATVMKYNGSSWGAVVNDLPTEKYAYWTSLAIDSGGTPYIAYLGRDGYHGVITGTVSVMKYNGSSWVNVGNGLPTEKAYFIRLAIDSNGTPYIVYLNVDDLTGAERKGKVTVMKYNGGSWVDVGNENFATVLGNASVIGISLAFDNNDIPYVAYEDAENKIDILEIGNATVMKFDGGYWEVVGKAGFSTRGASSISLAFDDRNAPYVAYADHDNKNRATVMKYNGTFWGVVGTVGFSPTLVSQTSLVFYNNVPYVGYNGFKTTLSDNKITVMKFDNRY